MRKKVKKNMKKTLACIMAALTLAGCLAGCGGGTPAENTESTESTPAADSAQSTENTETPVEDTAAAEGENQEASADTQEEITFTWMINKVEIKNELEEVAQAYMDSHENITIITEVAGGSVEPYGTRLKAKLGSNDMPALFVTEGPSDYEMFDEYLVDLSDTKLAGMADDSLLAVSTMNGEVKALPMAIEGFGIIYNKTIFEQAGINPDEITSMEALREAAQLLDSKKDELGLEAVFCLPGKETWIIGSHMGSAFLNGEFEQPADAWNSPVLEWENQAAYKDFIDLQVEYGIVPQGDTKNVVNLTYSDQIEKGFALGRVAMVHNGNWVSQIIKGISPEMIENDEIGFLPTPIPGYREDCVRVIGTPYISLNAKLDESVQKAAMDFLEWLYTSEEGKDLVVNKLNMIPPYEGFEGYAIEDPLGADLLEYIAAGRTLPSLQNNCPSGFKNFMGEKVQEYLTGKDWDACVAEMIDKWAELASSN